MGVTPTFNVNNVSRARNLRKNPTGAELALWQMLRRRQASGFKFRRQVPIGPYIVDFVCFDKRLIIEVDDGQHTAQGCYDSERTAWLEKEGFRVIRFWNNEVLKEMEAVKEAIWAALGGESPPSKPSPVKERLA